MNKIFNNVLKNPLKLKIFFIGIFILFAIVIAIVSFLISYNYEKKEIQKQINLNAESSLSEKIDYLKHHLNMYRYTISSIKDGNIFKKYLQDQKNKLDLHSLFMQAISSNENIMQINYIDKDGIMNIGVERTDIKQPSKIIKDSDLENHSKQHYFQEVLKIKPKNRLWISNIDLDIENGEVVKPYRPIIKLAYPIYSGKNFKGIISIKIFMSNILKHITNSSLFTTSLVDKNGDILVGSYEADGKIVNLSWSKYLNDSIKKRKYFPNYLKDIIHFQKFDSSTIHSRNISSKTGLSQDIILVLKIKESKLQEIKEKTIIKIWDTIFLVLLISGPLGFLLALIPSQLSARVYSASKKLDEKTLLFDEYLEAMNENNIISRSNLKGEITYANENFCKVSGYTKKELLGKSHSILRNPQEPKDTFKILWLTIQSGKTWKGILKNKKKDGTFYDVDMAIIPIYNSNKEIIEYLAIRHEITELVEQRKSLITIATQDPLTLTGNRYKLTIDIDNHILNNIAVIDIDKFSTINNFYGYSIGDEVIIKFAELLSKNITSEFHLYRLHADKFAILNYTLDSEKFTDYMTKLNAIMIEAIIPTTVQEFDIVATCGISSESNDIILSTAEIVNKHAKKLNKKILKYSSKLNIEAELEKNIIWINKIKKGLEEDKIIIYFQPIYNNHTEKIEKYESLVRLQDEDGEIISPYYFLEIAKNSAQYIDITKVVIRKSFEKFKNLDIEFSINLTIEDILNIDLRNYLEDMLNEYNVAHKLVIELVESEGIEEFEIIHKYIRKLKNFGCKIAIDDFGTGYSNFEYLIKLDVHYIKIDGSMIKNINKDENTKAIVTTIIEFAQKIGYKTIAEYVASKEILETVKDLNIDYSQGYYIGIPQDKLI